MEAFRAYESKAAAIMARYGGVIERTIIEEPTDADKPVREVHLITFPDLDAFHRYRADPELAALADARAACIAHTELLIGRDGEI